jgi:hypothetical protein
MSSSASPSSTAPSSTSPSSRDEPAVDPRAGTPSRPSGAAHPPWSFLDIVSSEFLESALENQQIRSEDRPDAGIAIDEQLVRVVAVESQLRLEQANLFSQVQDARSWEPLGFARVGDYARERFGLSPRTLQEDARISRALREFPSLSHALRSRSLNWTHARLLTTVLSTVPQPERLEAERRWIEIARHTTTRELEALVAEAGDAKTTEPTSSESQPPAPAHTLAPGSSHAEEETSSLRWAIRLRRIGKRLWHSVCEAAQKSSGCPCSAEQVLEFLVAEVASAAPLTSSGDTTIDSTFCAQTALEEELRRSRKRDGRHIEIFEEWTGASEGFGSLPSCRSITAPSLPQGLFDTDGIDTDGNDADGTDTDGNDAVRRAFTTRQPPDPRDLDTQLRRVRFAMQRIDFQLGTLLRVLVDRRLHQEVGFATFKLYCTARLGISTSKAYGLVRLERRSWQSTPTLRQAYRDGRLSWLQTATLIPVIDNIHGEQWIKRATKVTLQRLSDEVALTLDQMDDNHRRAQAPPSLATDPRTELAERWERARVQMRALVVGTVARAGESHGPFSLRELPREPWGGDWLRVEASTDILFMLEETLARIQLPSEPRWHAFERMLLHALDAWGEVPRHRDPVFERDGWRCSVPTCSSRSQLHDHHIHFRSRGGSNALTNRVAVCVWHHQHAIHGTGSVVVHGDAPTDLHWKLGTQPGNAALLELEGDRYVR